MEVRFIEVAVLTSFFTDVYLLPLNGFVSTAISEILHGSFATFEGNIDIVSCGEKFAPSTKLINHLLRNNDESLAF